MKKLFFVLFLSILLSGFVFSQKKIEMGKIQSVKGKVYSQEKGAEFKKIVKPGTVLYGDTYVISDKASSAVILLVDETSITLEENSKLFINDYLLKDSQPGFGVINGVIKCRVKPVKKGSKFKVYSSLSVASVRGTEFEVGVAPDGSSRIRVQEGSVRVDGDDSGEELNADEESSALMQKDPVKIEKQASQSSDDWNGWMGGRKEVLKQNPSASMEAMNYRMEQSKKAAEETDAGIKDENDQEKNLALAEDYERKRSSALSMYGTASRIKDDFKKDTLVMKYYKAIQNIEDAWNALDSKVKERFAAIDKAYDEKAKEIDDKFKGMEEKLDNLDMK